MPELRADVKLARAVDAMRFVLQLQPMRHPAGGARQREYRREHIHREAHGAQQDAGVEIHVRIQLALDEVFVLERNLFQPHGHVEQRIVLAQVFEHLLRLRPESRARVGRNSCRCDARNP